MTYLKFKLGFIIFTLFYLIGFILMLYSFSQPLSGWNNEIALVQMILVLISGIVLALLIELFIYLRKKKKAKA